MTTRIMPIGDSITVGYDAGHPAAFEGYRKELYQQLVAAGYDVNMVGSQTIGVPDPTWDQDFEAYSGYPISSIQAAIPPALATYRPHIVLLLAGTNDCSADAVAAVAPAAMASLLSTIHGVSPSSRILVSPLPPGTVERWLTNVPVFNAALPGVVATAQAAGIPVDLVNVFDQLTASDISDQVHPTAGGYTKAARTWLRVLAPYLPAPEVFEGKIEVQVQVSWDGSGAFDGAYDDVTGDVAIAPGVDVDEGRDGAQTLSPPKIGGGSFELRNEDGAYSQERADSPVYQRVIPGRPVRYRAQHGQRRSYRSHTTYRAHVPYRGLGVWPLGRHLIDDISQTTDFGDRRVKLGTLGYETVLTRAVVTVAVQANIRTDQAVALLLDAAGWPADKRAISIGDTTLLYWWCDERKPWDALLELLGAEGPGTFYVDRDGVFHFENRNYRTITPRSTTSQASYFDRDDSARTAYRDHVPYRAHRLYRGRTGGLWFSSLQYDPGFKNIANRATYTTRRRALGAIATVWSYGASFDLTTGQSRTLIARPADPFQAAVAPVLTTDYTVAGGTVSVGLVATSGLVAFITVTATSGTPTVSGLQLRAQPLTVVSETTAQNSVDASASIAKFSPIPGQAIPITLAVAGWPEIDPASAEAVCDAWVDRYQVPRPLVTITLRNADAAHVRQILDRMPSDRITLVEANTGLSADVWANAAQLRISGAGGRVVELVLGCELCDTLSGAVWDVSPWDDPAAVWGI